MTQVFDNGKTRIVLITPQEDEKCEMCGKMEECRPYGPGGMNVCFDCAMKDEVEARRQLDARWDGKPPPPKPESH
jgi:ribosome-binding protein aMBF1 (putative translation factor)